MIRYLTSILRLKLLFSARLYVVSFFRQSGRMRWNKRYCMSSWDHRLFATPAHPPCRRAEGRSGPWTPLRRGTLQYLTASARASFTVPAPTDAEAGTHLDITAARCARTEWSQSDPHTVFLLQQQRGAGKVWRNAAGLPAPDQPGFGLQQPARWAANGGLLVRPDAPAGRLLQLRHRWVTAYIRPFGY